MKTIENFLYLERGTNRDEYAVCAVFNASLQVKVARSEIHHLLFGSAGAPTSGRNRPSSRGSFLGPF